MEIEKKSGHGRKGKFVRIKNCTNLYRYSANNIYYGVFRHNGKQIWKSLKTTDRQMAQRLLEEERRLQGRIDPSVSSLTLAGLIERYLANLKQFDTKTIATRRGIAKNFTKTWTFSLDKKVSDVKPMELHAWLGQHRSRLKKASYNEYIRFLRQLFEIAIENKVIAESPAASIKEAKREMPIRETPTWEQFRQVVQEIRSQKFNADAEYSADLVQFIGLSGLGNAEISNLRLKNVDLAGNQIRVFRKKTDTGFQIPLFPGLRPFLVKLIEKLGINPSPEASLLRVHDAKKAITGACERLNFPHFSHRSFRRCFITTCIEKGVDFKTIASFQGHRDGGVLIARTYSHLRSEHVNLMAERLTDLTI